MPFTPPADTTTIAELLGPDSSWPDLRHVTETGSTNKDVAALALAGAAEGLALISEHQTSGKGRFDRPWQAPPGSSVGLSVLLRPTGTISDWSWLPLVAGLAVLRGVRALAPSEPEAGRVGLKWPNDVLVDGTGKICGILAERHETSLGAAAVVGMGINVDLAADELPAPTATSLAAIGFDTDKNRLVAHVLAELASLYQTWQSRGHLRETYTKDSLTLGQQVRVEMSPTTSVTGRATDIDASGALVVQTDRGPVTFMAGDVHHLRPHRG